MDSGEYALKPIWKKRKANKDYQKTLGKVLGDCPGIDKNNKWGEKSTQVIKVLRRKSLLGKIK